MSWDVGRLQPDALKVNTLIRNAIKILQKIWPWRGPDTRSKCMVTMNPTQAGQSGAVGTESASPGPSEDLQGPKRGLSGPKRTLFACFLELGGSIWAITVLNEPGIPLRRSGHPTSLYLKQKEFPKKLGRGN